MGEKCRGTAAKDEARQSSITRGRASRLSPLSGASLLMIQERGTSSSFVKVTNGSGLGSLGNQSGEE